MSSMIFTSAILPDGLGKVLFLHSGVRLNKICRHLLENPPFSLFPVYPLLMCPRTPEGEMEVDREGKEDCLVSR
jgi:hypothetical protein